MTGSSAPLRPWLLAAAAYAALTVPLTYPLAVVAAGATTHPSDDPLLNTWILWWSTQAVPLTADWWNAPMFHPTRGTLAFSEHLLGLVPLSAPVQWWTGNPLLAHNVVVLLSFPLSALSAHALAFQLTRRHDAAAIAGLAYGFSPYRANEMGHVQMLSYYWAPIVLLALHRYAHDARRRWLALFGAACLLQALANGYALFHLPVLIAIWLAWFRLGWRRTALIAASWLGSVLALAPILMPYARIQERLHLSRSIGDVRAFSADIGSLFSAPWDVVLLDDVLTWVQPYGLFPGLTLTSLLVAAGVFAWRSRRRAPSPIPPGFAPDRRIALAAALVFAAIAASVFIAGPWQVGPVSVGQGYKPLTVALVAALYVAARGPGCRRAWRDRSLLAFGMVGAALFYILAFGPEPRLFGERVFYQAPYAWLMRLPGYDAIRAPDRFAMLAMLCLAVGGAVAYGRWRVPRWGWLLICAGIAADGWITVAPVPSPTPGPAAPWPVDAAVIELPLNPDRDAAALYRSIASGRRLVNGTSGYAPPHYGALVEALGQGDVEALEALAEHTTVGILVDRSARASAGLSARLATLDGITALDVTPEWARFLLPQRPLTATLTATTVDPATADIPILAIRANRNGERAGSLIDGRLDTIWTSGEQAGSEEVQFELGAETAIRSVVLHLGACPFGWPRELAVDLSRDGASWTEVWRGPMTIATVRGALWMPERVPIWASFAPTAVRHVRLRQLASEPNAQWCMGEVSVQ